jgi:hypothetical protein
VAENPKKGKNCLVENYIFHQIILTITIMINKILENFEINKSNINDVKIIMNYYEKIINEFLQL